MTIEPGVFIDLTQNLISTNLGYLGLSITLLLFVGGFFYIFNFKPLQESIEKQEGELRSLKNDINNKIEVISKSFGDVVLTQTNETRALISRTTEEINILKKDINKKSADSEKETQEFINKANQELIALRLQAQTIELNGLWIEQWMWDGREVPANTLRALVELMEKMIEYRNIFAIDTWLSRVKDTLSNIKKSSVDDEDKKLVLRLSSVLEKVKGEEKEKDDIRTKINQILS